MKRKIIIAFSACLIAAVSIINVHLTQSDHNMDFSLEDIAVMAQANINPAKFQGLRYCTMWKISYACIDQGADPCWCNCCMV